MKLQLVLAAILAIKAVWLALDHTPSYFFGDSEAYLATAVIHYISTGRSFFYGFLIRRVALHLHSLEALIYLQSFLTAIAAWLLSVILYRIFRAPFFIAAGIGILCAFEPIELLMERYVMTEAVSNFLFAVHFALVLAYVRRGRLWWLLVSQVFAVAAIAIRISFLPEILLNSVLAPLLSPQAVVFYRSWLRGVRGNRAALKTVAVHLALCLLISQVCLTAYKHWYGALMHRRPALLYEDGTFLLTDVAPLVAAQDFPDHARGEAILRRVRLDLKNPDNRPAQHFAPEGIWNAVQTEYKDEQTANKIARRAATHAMFREPVGVAKLALGTFLEFFDREKMKNGLVLDEGDLGGFGPDAVRWLEERFGVRNVKNYELTLTKRWHQAAIPWYWCILAVLPLSPVLLFWGPRDSLRLRIVVVLTALVFLEGVTLTTDRPCVRYLEPAAWIVLLEFGIVAQTLIERSRSTTADGPRP